MVSHLLLQRRQLRLLPGQTRSVASSSCRIAWLDNVPSQLKVDLTSGVDFPPLPCRCLHPKLTQRPIIAGGPCWRVEIGSVSWARLRPFRAPCRLSWPQSLILYYMLLHIIDILLYIRSYCIREYYIIYDTPTGKLWRREKPRLKAIWLRFSPRIRRRQPSFPQPMPSISSLYSPCRARELHEVKFQVARHLGALENAELQARGLFRTVYSY